VRDPALTQTPRGFRVALFRVSAAGKRACLFSQSIQFRYSSHFFLRVEPFFELFERRDVGVGSKPRASKADGVVRQKFNSPDGIAVDQPPTQEIVQVEIGLQPLRIRIKNQRGSKSPTRAADIDVDDSDPTDRPALQVVRIGQRCTLISLTLRSGTVPTTKSFTK
jgi:hypothetical protein